MFCRITGCSIDAGLGQKFQVKQRPAYHFKNSISSILNLSLHFSFSTRLITEDQVLLYSWIVMVACGTSGLVQIPKSSVNSYKTKMLATLLRCLGWIALAISATSNAAYYYWCFPPCLAVVVVLISLNSLQA